MSKAPSQWWLATTSAVALLLALVPGLPYGYFTLLRFAVCASSAAIAFWASEKQSAWLMWSHGFLAVLYNPFVKVHFSRDLWQPIDLVAAMFMLVTSAIIFRKVRAR